MAISVFDIFKIGIGPSSSHTVGPMRAARMFTSELGEQDLLGSVTRVKAQMFGSLGATGRGHATDTAVLLGLAGHDPETIDPDQVDVILQHIRSAQALRLDGTQSISFDERRDVQLDGTKRLAFHPNGMCFTAIGTDDRVLLEKTYYSVGGGFIVSDAQAKHGTDRASMAGDDGGLPLTFRSAAELMLLTREQSCSIAQVMRRNECHWRSEQATQAGLLKIWQVMQDCVARGCRTEGELPGRLRVRRRAAAWHRKLLAGGNADPLEVMDWVNLYALAVNEENASGGRVVTAPTNGAAGIIPAVLHYYKAFVDDASDDGVADFLLTAAAIGVLYKTNASISGAEVGCQGEVGVACSMAAAGLCAVLGGTPEQIENAAEIGMEHHLGLTCDPVGGLVQIPCIERNAIAAVKAINAARMALQGDGRHHVSLDQVIATMRQTGADMSAKYKETALGGLAVSIVEC